MIDPLFLLLEQHAHPGAVGRRYDSPMPAPADQTEQVGPTSRPSDGSQARKGGADVDITDPQDLASRVEAVLLTQDRALAPARVAEALGLSGAAGASKVREAVERLNESYDKTGRSFRIESTAGGLRVMTLPRYADAVAAAGRSRSAHRMSRAAVETLAVIAYKQPITRAEIESIRGVACGEVLRTLLERRLIAITGRAEELGRPMLYGCTREFFEAFGLRGPKDLPDVGEFVASATRAAAPDNADDVPPSDSPEAPESEQS